MQIKNILSLDNNRIQNLADPVSALDAVNKRTLESYLLGNYSTTIGDGSTLVYPVTHNLNSNDLMVNLVEISTGNLINANVVITDANTITITFGVSPALNNIRVIVASIETINSPNELPVGVVMEFTSNVVPSGWLLCNGQAVSRTTYANLFASIGILYGGADGILNFNVPDFRGCFLRGSGTHGSLLMSNGSAFSGGSLGSFGLDRFQGHNFDQYNSNIAPPGIACAVISSSYSNGDLTGLLLGVPTSDGTNGTPRIGSETNPFYSSINYIIKA